MIKPYYVSIGENLQEEEKLYSEELGKTDWKYIKEASELFLVHAYLHLFETSSIDWEVFGDVNYKMKYSQFYLNLAVGLELLLKSILLKKGEKINQPLKKGVNGNLNPERTISFRVAINEYLDKIFPKMSETTIQEIKDTLRLINLRRDNIAHRSKRSFDSYLHEYRFSYITLYIYEEFFYGENTELVELLLKSIKRSKVTTGADFKPLRIKPRSLRVKGSM